MPSIDTPHRIRGAARVRAPTLALVLVAVLAGAAHASPMTITGGVSDVRSHWTADGTRIVTEATVHMDDGRDVTVSQSPVTATATRGAGSRGIPPVRLVVLALALAAVLAGLDAALLRLGVAAPVRSESLADQHGVLMVYGFLGTAIALERAVALQAGVRRAPWAYAAPAAGGLGALLVLLQATALPMPHGRELPGGAWVAAMALFVAIYVAVWRRQQSFAVLVQLLGAVAGLFGAALWARGLEVAAVVPWWATLLVLTIVGERLELHPGLPQLGSHGIEVLEADAADGDVPARDGRGNHQGAGLDAIGHDLVVHRMQ